MASPSKAPLARPIVLRMVSTVAVQVYHRGLRFRSARYVSDGSFELPDVLEDAPAGRVLGELREETRPTKFTRPVATATRAPVSEPHCHAFAIACKYP